ncbi:hypothetical protein [Achromobacter sp. AGC39]
MSQEGKFWASLWALAAICLIAGIGALWSYNANRDRQVAEMVKAGADPIYSACSLGSLRDTTCSLYFAGDRAR